LMYYLVIRCGIMWMNQWYKCIREWSQTVESVFRYWISDYS